MSVNINGTTGVTTPAVTLVGAGTVNLVAPSTSGTYTLAMPAGNGTALIATSSGTVNLTNSSGGTLVLQPAPGAGTTTVTFPAGNGTNGQFLQTDGAGNTVWASSASGSLTIGSTAIASGTTGSLLINTGGTLQQIVMGSNVAATLANAAGGANGFATLNGSGVLPAAQGGLGGPVNSSWTSILGTAPGTGVSSALSNNVGTAGSIVVNGGALGTPASGTLTNCTGLPVSTGLSGLGTGVGVALTNGVGTSGGIALVDGAIGTPSSITLTNATGLPISTGVSGLGTSVASALGVNVGTAGSFVVNGGALGVPSGGTLTNCTGLPLGAGVTGILPTANGGTGIATIGVSGTTLVSDGTVYAAGYPARTTNLSNGNAWEVPYQTATHTTGFVSAGVTGEVLGANTGGAPAWVAGDITIGTTAIALGGTSLTLAGLTTLTLTQDPTSGLEAATKQYVDAKTSGLQDIGVAKAATTGDITLSGTQTVDTIPLVATDICLVKNQSDPTKNGLYQVQAGPWTYVSSANTWLDYPSAVVFVQQGATNANSSWIQTNLDPAGTLGGTAQTWVIQSSPVTSYSAGTGINILVNQISNTGVLSVSGGSTGLTFDNATGTCALQGTLAVGYGGTGLTTLGTGVTTALGINTGAVGGIYTVGSALGTPSSLDLANASNLPISTGVAGLGTSVASALAVNVGTAGSVVVDGGVLGTPSSGTLNNCTGLPVSTGISGLGTSVATALGIAVGTSGSIVLNGGALGTPTSGTLTSCTGLPVSTGISGLGSNVATALGVAVGTAGSFVVDGGALGTPSGGTLTSCTGLPVSTGLSGLGTNVATALGVAVGTAGAFVVNGGALGTPSSGDLTSCTNLPLSTGVTGTLPIANGGTGQVTANAAFNALAPAQTTANGKFLTSDGTNTSWATVSSGLTVGTTSITGGTNGNILYNNSTVVGEKSVTGTGDVVLKSGPEITSLRETKTNGTISAGTLAINCAAGNVLAISLNANITTVTFSNVPATGSAYSIILSFTADGTARTITWPAAVRWPGGTAPTMTSTNNKVDTIVLYTYDGGTNWFGFVSGQNA